MRIISDSLNGHTHILAKLSKSLTLTLSSSVVSNGYASNCSGPYRSNTSF